MAKFLMNERKKLQMPMKDWSCLGEVGQGVLRMMSVLARPGDTPR